MLKGSLGEEVRITIDIDEALWRTVRIRAKREDKTLPERWSRFCEILSMTTARIVAIP